MAPRTPSRKDDIVAAALTCLQRDGYAALTARKIAAEAGLSPGHISYHFASMDDLMSQAYHLAANRLRQSEATLLAATSTPVQRLQAFLAAGFTSDFLQRPHLRMRIDLWSAALSHPAIAETERALYDRYRAALVQHLTALAAPGKAVQVPAVTDLIMATLDGLWLDWMRRSDAAAVQNGLTLCLTLAQAELT
jgi:TetR/AcrR family transcriptional repressor of bet genes